jgi:peptidoglycan/xylan/chitin deacetylase (PgdA/CDA1 family)
VTALARFRRVRVTFDDAFRSVAVVFPELERLDVPIGIFVCTGYAHDGAPLTIPELATDDPDELATMTWDQLRDLAGRGAQVGSHTVSHPRLPELSDVELRRELTDSKEQIEAELERPCPELAYPYGEHDERVRTGARNAGYERAYALDVPRGDPYAAPRLDLYRRHSPARAVLMSTRLGRFVA